MKMTLPLLFLWRNCLYDFIPRPRIPCFWLLVKWKIAKIKRWEKGEIKKSQRNIILNNHLELNHIFKSWKYFMCRDIPLPANDILRITHSFIFSKTYINFSYSLTKKWTYLVGFLLDFYWWLFVLNFLYFFLLFLLTGCNLKQHDLIKS